MATHSFSSRNYSSPLPFRATLSNSKADRIKSFLLPLSACHCISVSNQIWTKPFLFLADLCNSKAVSSRCLPLPFRGFSYRLCGMQFPCSSMPFQCEAHLSYSHAFPSRTILSLSCASLSRLNANPFQRHARPRSAFPTLVCRKSADKACNLFNG